MVKDLNSVFAYLKWRGDLSFDKDPFNEVDGFILSQITFLNFTGIIGDEPMLLIDALKKYFELNPKDKIKLGLIIPKNLIEMYSLILKIKRYDTVLVSDVADKYDKKKKEQFAALTFHVDDLVIIAYKGTDDTLIGWEEDFNMIVSFPIAAQISALEYLNNVTSKFKHKKYIVLGHSKGGNLAMYSSLYTTENVQKHIQVVYNYDGPGFEKDDLDEELYSKMKSKIRTILPEHSAIGMIFEQLGKIKAVKSNVNGIFQHDGLSWQVEGTKFVKTTLSSDSINFSRELNQMVSMMSENDRKAFCNALEKYTELSGVKTLLELKSAKKKLANLFKAFSRKDQGYFLKLIKICLKYKIITLK